MQWSGIKSWHLPALFGLSKAFAGSRACVMLFASAVLLLRSMAEDVEVPDYFSTARLQNQSRSQTQIAEDLTEADAESLVKEADEALQKLAGGDVSAADSFASIFGQSVDYYDEGWRTPRQIASDKAAIFRNYRSYSTQRMGKLVLSNSDSPDTKWASFSYRYEIVKRSGGILRGVADARWALQRVDGKVVVIAAKETTHRQ